MGRRSLPQEPRTLSKCGVDSAFELSLYSVARHSISTSCPAGQAIECAPAASLRWNAPASWRGESIHAGRCGSPGKWSTVSVMSAGAGAWSVLRRSLPVSLRRGRRFPLGQRWLTCFSLDVLLQRVDSRALVARADGVDDRRVLAVARHQVAAPRVVEHHPHHRGRGIGPGRGIGGCSANAVLSRRGCVQTTSAPSRASEGEPAALIGMPSRPLISSAKASA